ncbi:MAG: DUF87 domain-containing protein [archaeon]
MEDNLKPIQRKHDLMLTVLVVFSIIGMIAMGNYIGQVAYHEGYAGYIYSMEITWGTNASLWGGVYGAAFGVGVTNAWSRDMSGGALTDYNEFNIFFECFESGIEHEIYASMVPLSQISFSTLLPADPSDVDAYLENAAGMSAASNTYTQNITFEVGGTAMTVPGTYTYKIDEAPPYTTFSMGILKDENDNLVFVSKVIVNLTDGFNGRYYNYQVLLPVRNNTVQTYYLWSDPTDICPEGEGTEPNKGNVSGNVLSTTGEALENVIVEVAGRAAVSNALGNYLITNVEQGSHRIFAIKTGYEVYQSNLTVYVGETTIHNIIMVPNEDEQDYSNVDVGPGTDAPGDSTHDYDYTETETETAQYEEPKEIEGADYIISISEINRRIRIGNFLQEMIKIYSFKTVPATVNFELTGNVTDLIEMDKEVITVNPYAREDVTLTIFGRGKEGIYTGSLEISGDLNATVPIIIELLSKDKLPVEALVINLDTNKKTVTPGDEIKIQTDLHNMLSDQGYPVRLFYTIQDIYGNNTLWTYDSNVFIKTAFTTHRTIKIPTDAEPGDYVVRVTAHYLGLSSGASVLFEIEQPFYKYRLFGVLPLWLLFVIIGGGALGYYFWLWWKKRQEEKKKYHLKVDYKELPGPGPRSLFVGKIAETDHKTYFNAEKFKTHTIVAGSTGGGKSFSAQGIIEELLIKNVAIIVFDPTAQWTGMLRKLTHKGILGLYPGFGMKPAEARAFNGNIRQITNPRELIDIRKYMKPGEIQVFTVHKLDPKDIDIFVANTIREVFHANFGESEALRLVLVYDEVHRLLPKFGGSGEGFLQIERACREFRKWGIGVMLISQVLADFVGQIKANINTEVQMRTRDEGDLERIRIKYGEEVLRSLVKASVGTGMVENPSYNRGKPYFITFRPIMHSVQRLTDEEIDKYNKYNEQIEQLQYELEQLENFKIDMFDLKLELKLALDKVKSGNFNMVDIYLEGLKPRIQKHWEKLGKKPKTLERKLVSEADIQEAIAIAKKARSDYEKTQEKKKASGSGEGEEKKEQGISWKTEVSPDKLLNLKNGMIVINLASLYDEIAAMKDEDFAKEVDDKHNDIADWVTDKLGDQELGALLASTTSKVKMLEFLDMKKSGKKLPKPVAVVAAPAEKSAEGDKKEEVKEEGAKPEEKKEEKPQQPPTEIPPAKPESEITQPQTEIQIKSDQYFKLEDGTELRSLQELKDYATHMSDDMFYHHVTDGRNDFANWVRGVFNDTGLADKLQGVRTKDDLMSILSS